MANGTWCASLIFRFQQEYISLKRENLITLMKALRSEVSFLIRESLPKAPWDILIRLHLFSVLWQEVKI